MSSVKLDGKSYKIQGGMPKVGSEAPDFTFVRSNLSETSLYDFNEQVKVVLAIPSVETGVCQREARKFNETLAEMDGVKAIFISKDLPFSIKKFCATEGIENIEMGSDYRYDDFSLEYGVEIVEGIFKGLFARAAFVIDKNNKIRYAELVPEVGQEPNYDAIMEIVEKLLK